MPTRTGKTVTLLSLITSYELAGRPVGKLIYFTRTVHEMEKVFGRVEKVARLSAKGAGIQARILALGLTSPKNLCIHRTVRAEGSRESVDAGCRKVTASWVRAQAMEVPDISEAIGAIHEGQIADHSSGETEGPVSFVTSLNKEAAIDQRSLKFCYDRLHSLTLTLEITDMDELLHIRTICDFATLVGTYSRGFSIIIEPYDEPMPHIPEPVLQVLVLTLISRFQIFFGVVLSAGRLDRWILCTAIQLSCLDSSLAIKRVSERFQTVVITSGTLIPIDLYPRLLNFNPVIIQSFAMTLSRDCL